MKRKRIYEGGKGWIDIDTWVKVSYIKYLWLKWNGYVVRKKIIN